LKKMIKKRVFRELCDLKGMNITFEA